MKKKLLLLLAVASTCFAMSSPAPLKEDGTVYKTPNILDDIRAIALQMNDSPGLKTYSLTEIKEMLIKEAPSLSASVINKVITTLKCANENNVEYNDILTVIDYSLPSNQKRLWVFSLKEKKLLFYTYVSHGLKSGALLSQNFSNKFNSKASSLGVYRTDKMYNGRHGLSLRLDGLEMGFNDNATNRSVVMHGGWYVEERFIKKYGRAGRSWGCPAVPDNLTNSIINTIKDNSLFVVYYPDEKWIVKSRFLNCQAIGHAQNILDVLNPSLTDAIEPQDNILFVSINGHKNHQENEPVVVISADDYTEIFAVKPPLNRMLRRQINEKEYIALSDVELKRLVTSQSSPPSLTPQKRLDIIYFVIPEVKMVRGYYATEMKMVNLGKIKEVKWDEGPVGQAVPKDYTIYFESNHHIRLGKTNQFIRWLGL